LGAKSTSGGNPTVDNDGDALVDGALFFDTTNNVLMVYNLGTTTWLRTTPTSSDQTAINTVNSNASNINTVAGVSANVTTVAGISSAVSNVSSISSAVSGVNTISSAVSAVNSNSSNINAVSSDLGGSNNIGTVAGSITNVNLTGGSIANVNTVASNLSSVNNFANTYRIGGSDPTSSLDTGDLFYNTSSNQMKVYNGSAWEAGVLAGAGTLLTTNNLSDLANRQTAQSNLGRYHSKTVSTNQTLAANAEVITGTNLVINNGVTLTIPNTSRLEVRFYASGEVL